MGNVINGAATIRERPRAWPTQLAHALIDELARAFHAGDEPCSDGEIAGFSAPRFYR